MSLSRDLQWLRDRIADRDATIAAREAEAARLRARLRQILNCTNPKCTLCAACLAAVREDEHG